MIAADAILRGGSPGTISMASRETLRIGQRLRVLHEKSSRGFLSARPSPEPGRLVARSGARRGVWHDRRCREVARLSGRTWVTHYKLPRHCWCAAALFLDERRHRCALSGYGARPGGLVGRPCHRSPGTLFGSARASGAGQPSLTGSVIFGSDMKSKQLSALEQRNEWTVCPAMKK